MIALEKRKEYFLTLFRYLNLIINSKYFCQREDYKLSIRREVSSVFPLLHWLSSPFGDESEKVMGFHKKFITLFMDGVEFELTSSEDFESKSAVDIEEEIGYIRVFIRNTFEIDLDLVKDEEFSVMNSPTSDSYRKQSDSLAVYQSFFHVDPGEAESISKTINDVVVKSHAWSRLQQDIDSGSIYIYRTKPRRNPMIKNVVVGLCIAGIIASLFLLAASIFSFPVAIERKGTCILNSVLSCCFFSFYIYQIRKSFANDNYKYSFQRAPIFFSFLYGMFSSLLNTFAFDSKNDTFLKSLNLIMCAVVIISSIIWFFSYVCLQPKKNTELIERLMNQHSSNTSANNSIN